MGYGSMDGRGDGEMGDNIHGNADYVRSVCLFASVRCGGGRDDVYGNADYVCSVFLVASVQRWGEQG